mmetsp:Transcript_24383/g.79603  ORF Transcript_24383/g.79603 Transcript_24383/m.79603 type:complete len:219 (+) Transcript_24383:1505-2161(+)
MQYTSTLLRCQPAPSELLSCPIMMRLSAPRFGMPLSVKTSTAARSKLFLELARLFFPLSPLSPYRVTKTLASVPANLMSEVYTVTLKSTLAAFGSSVTAERTCVVCLGGSLSSSQRPHGKYHFLERSRSTTSTDSRCQPAPKFLLSCPMTHLVSSPRSSMRGRSNTSIIARSKLFLELLSGISSGLFLSLPSFSPMSVTKTLASVPANLMSLVITVTW